MERGAEERGGEGGAARQRGEECAEDERRGLGGDDAVGAELAEDAEEARRIERDRGGGQ